MARKVCHGVVEILDALARVHLTEGVRVRHLQVMTRKRGRGGRNVVLDSHLMSGLAIARADGPSVEDKRRNVVLLIPLGDVGHEGLFGHVKLV